MSLLLDNFFELRSVSIEASSEFTWKWIFEFLFGTIEDYSLVEDSNLFQQVHDANNSLCCVSTDFGMILSSFSFLLTFRALQKSKKMISNKIHLGQIGKYPWNSISRQCAWKACTEKTGHMLPLDMGGPFERSGVSSFNYRGSIICCEEKIGTSPQYQIEL